MYRSDGTVTAKLTEKMAEDLRDGESLLSTMGEATYFTNLTKALLTAAERSGFELRDECTELLVFADGRPLPDGRRGVRMPNDEGKRRLAEFLCGRVEDMREELSRLDSHEAWDIPGEKAANKAIGRWVSGSSVPSFESSVLLCFALGLDSEGASEFVSTVSLCMNKRRNARSRIGGLDPLDVSDGAYRMCLDMGVAGAYVMARDFIGRRNTSLGSASSNHGSQEPCGAGTLSVAVDGYPDLTVVVNGVACTSDSARRVTRTPIERASVLVSDLVERPSLRTADNAVLTESLEGVVGNRQFTPWQAYVSERAELSMRGVTELLAARDLHFLRGARTWKGLKGWLEGLRSCQELPSGTKELVGGLCDLAVKADAPEDGEWDDLARGWAALEEAFRQGCLPKTLLLDYEARTLDATFDRKRASIPYERLYRLFFEEGRGYEDNGRGAMDELPAKRSSFWHNGAAAAIPFWEGFPRAKVVGDIERAGNGNESTDSKREVSIRKAIVTFRFANYACLKRDAFLSGGTQAAGRSSQNSLGYVDFAGGLNELLRSCGLGELKVHDPYDYFVMTCVLACDPTYGGDECQDALNLYNSLIYQSYYGDDFDDMLDW